MKNPITLPEEEMYRLLVENARDVIFTLAPDGTFTSLNPVFETATGWLRSEWLGKSFVPLLSSTDLSRAAELFQRVLQGEAPPMFELCILSRSQEPIFAEFMVSPQIQDGEVVSILGIVRNVTERKRAEEERRRADVAEAAQLALQQEIAERRRVEEQLRYRLTLEKALAEVSTLFACSAPADLTRILQLLGEAVQANRSYLFLLREDGSTVDNTHEWCDSKTEAWRERLQGIDPALFPWWKAQIEKGTPIIIPDTRLLPAEAGGEKALLESQGVRSLLAVPVNSPSGRPIGFLGFDDIEHCRTWSEEDLRLLRVVSEMLSGYLARTHAEQQRNDFLAMLTHDIKNPVNVIVGYAELLIEEARSGIRLEEQKKMLLRLHSNSLTLHSLVTNYLDMSKIESGRLIMTRQPLSMNAVVRSVVQQYEAEADRQQVTVHVCLPDDVPAIDGDHFALERVFANLLHNALKFTPGGGRITVDSGYDGSDVWVSITDTGPGIPPEELSSLFEKYQQAGRGRSQEGTGLGLFIVRALVEAHGGHVTIQSTPGQGACFSIFLPVASLSVRAAL